MLKILIATKPPAAASSNASRPLPLMNDGDVRAIVIVVGLIALFHLNYRQASHNIACFMADAKLCNALAFVCCALDGRSKFFRVSSTCI